MPESHLWLVNHLGGAFTLGTFRQKFKQLENTWDGAVSVKRLSASHWCAWAIGHDHRVYIYVRSSDVPIRVSETTFENQRWSLIHRQFSKKGIIKTDRPAWSNEAGTVYRPKESVRLPSAHWDWEGDWLIDENLRGEVVGIEGWQYAFDFPAVYTPEKRWNSCVRKRKWIRFRRFSSTDLWARISDMEVVERAECFIDVSVGGFLMPSQPAGFLSVWAVTNDGHVYVRTNVNHDNPEGSTWQELKITDHTGIINISVGASNLVWAVTWDGNTLVRTDVTRNNIYGSDWVMVEHPDNLTRFMQVSVGRNSVWAISREGKVWFRKGTSGDDMFWNHSSAIGTSWVEMVGEMSQVAVSSNDQVFAIDLAGKNICFRTGVNAGDSTGKTWQPISLHEDLTPLQKEGLLSEGDICSCGDPDSPCALHAETRPRRSSTTTTCSSLSVATCVEDNSDKFMPPLQLFPIHITEQFDSSPLWKHTQFMTSQTNISGSSPADLQVNDTFPSLDAGYSSCPILPTDFNGTVNENEPKALDNSADMQESFNSHTITQSVSQMSALSQHLSNEEEIQFSQHTTTAVLSSSTTTAVLSSSTTTELSSSTTTVLSPSTTTVLSSSTTPANLQVTESLHEGIFPTAETPKGSIPEPLSARVDRLGNTSIAVDNSTENPHAVKEHTFSANLYGSVEKIDSENCVIAACDSKCNIDDIQIQITTLIPFTNVTVDNVHVLKSESSSLSVETISTNQSLSKCNDFCESDEQTSTSHVGDHSETNISREAFNRVELTFAHSDNKPHTSTTSDDVFPINSSPVINNYDNKTHTSYTSDDVFPINSSPVINNYDNKTHTSYTSDDVFPINSSPGVIKLAEVNTESLIQHSNKNQLNTGISRFTSSEENNSSPDIGLSNISINKNTSHPFELPSNHTNNKGQGTQKKKSKERRPKIVDLSCNDPNDDSVVFKTFKTRRKRREKPANTTSANVEKADTASLSSDTSHTLMDVTEPDTTSEDINISPESPENETYVDFVDGGNKYPDYPDNSGYQSPSTDSSSFLSFQNISSLSGDYFNSVGFTTDSVLTMLVNSETIASLLNQPQALMKVIPEVDITEHKRNRLKPTSGTNGNDGPKPESKRNSPKSVVGGSSRNSPKSVVGGSGRNSPKFVFGGSGRNSPKSGVNAQNDRNSPNTVVHAGSGRNSPKHDLRAQNGRNSPKSDVVRGGRSSPKPVVAGSGSNSPNAFAAERNINNSKPVGASDNTHLPGTPVKKLNGSELIPQGETSVVSLKVSSQQDTVRNDSDGPVIHYGSRGGKLLGGSEQLISNENNFSVDLPKPNGKTEKICAPGSQDSEEFNIPAAETVAGNIVENQSSSGDNTVEASIVAQVAGLVERCESTDNSIMSKQQLKKIEEFFNNTCSSIDSTSNSEEVIDFVTDLLVSDDETLDKKDALNEDMACHGFKGSSEDDETGDLWQSQPIFNSMGSLKSNFQGQASVNSSRSRASSWSNVIRDSNEESDHPDIKNTLQEHPAKKVSRYLKSPSVSYVPAGNIIPIVALTMAQPRLSWKWLDATSCVIDDPSAVEWLSNVSKESESKKKVVKIAKQLREDIMRKLQDRNKKEVHKFKDIEQAVKRTTWVKKASMQVYLYGKKSHWIACNVELEQGISNLSEGSITVHFQHRGKQKNTQITLSEISCVKTSSDTDNPSGFVVYTPVTNIIHQPLTLKANSENEAADWIGCLVAANAGAWNMNSPEAPGAIWSCTFIGDVFVSSAPSTTKPPSELCWGQHGGHTRLIETGPSGVTWSLGFDRMPYVYNGGYGGAVNNGTSDMSDKTNQIVDQHKVFVYENQTWFPVVGWCCKGVFHNDFHWLTESGRSVETKEEVKLPSSKCQWVSDWTVDCRTAGGVDTNGWQYSTSLYGPFVPRQHLRSSYRRRRWFRQYKITVLGPWNAAGSLGLVDLSVQIDPVASNSDPVVLWAVGANGDVLCRNGVSANNPKGQSWIHVATFMDKPFKSISVGGNYRVWGIAGDGSTWFRPGVSPYNQAGTRWLQVVPPPPGSFLLHQVSAGATSVWAVDTGDNLWRRENITPTFPEGTGWEFVAGRVKRVSVGPRDQVWIIADASFSKMKHGAGVIYSRVGITSDRPAGTDWEVVIGSGWAHVSVRGVCEVKQKDSSPGLEDESSI